MYSSENGRQEVRNAHARATARKPGQGSSRYVGSSRRCRRTSRGVGIATNRAMKLHAQEYIRRGFQGARPWRPTSVVCVVGVLRVFPSDRSRTHASTRKSRRNPQGGRCDFATDLGSFDAPRKLVHNVNHVKCQSLLAWESPRRSVR